MSTSADTLSSSAPRPVRRGLPFGYIVIGIIVVGIGALIVATASGGRYELEVGVVATAPERFAGSEVRVRGQIKEGSIVATTINGQPLTRFTLVDENGHELPIVSNESPPDNFEGGKSCIVEGKLTDSASHVESTRISMKCPSKYEAEADAPAASNDKLRERYGGQRPTDGSGPGI